MFMNWLIRLCAAATAALVALTLGVYVAGTLELTHTFWAVAVLLLAAFCGWRAFRTSKNPLNSPYRRVCALLMPVGLVVMLSSTRHTYRNLLEVLEHATRDLTFSDSAEGIFWRDIAVAVFGLMGSFGYSKTLGPVLTWVMAQSHMK